MTFDPPDRFRSQPGPNEPHGAEPPPAPYGTTGWTPPNQPPQYAPGAEPVPTPIIGYPRGHPPGYLPGVPVPPLVTPKRPTAKRKLITAGIVAVVVVFVLCCGGFALLTTITGWPGSTSKTAIDPTAAALLNRTAVLSWLTGGGSGLVDKLGADFEEFHAASGVRGQQNANTAIHVSCGHFQADTKAAQAYKPIPDQQAQALWAKALAAYARGAMDCLSATDRNDASLLSHAADEIGQGNATLSQVTARMQQLLTG